MDEASSAETDTMKGEGPRARGSGTESVYKALRHEILAWSAHRAVPLDETRLSEHFGMSRTPIREALLRLTSEGWSQASQIEHDRRCDRFFQPADLFRGALPDVPRDHPRRCPASGRCLDGADHQASGGFAEAVEAQDALRHDRGEQRVPLAIAERAGNPYYTPSLPACSTRAAGSAPLNPDLR